MKRLRTVAAILAVLMICACGADKEPYVDPTEGFVESEMQIQLQSNEAEKESPEQTADPEDGEPLENQDAYDKPAEVSVTATAVMESIKAAVTLPEMYAADDAYILNNYGIDPVSLDSYAIEEALEVTQADKIIIIDPAEGTDVKEISDKLETFRQDKAMEMEDYLPEQYDVIATASVKEKDGFIYLVISPEAEKIEAVIENSIGKQE